MTRRWHLGINLGHDRSAALVCEGEIRIAIHQERLDGQKYSLGLSLQAAEDPRRVQPPWEAVRYCLDGVGIGWDDIATVTANLPGEDHGPEILAAQLPPGLEGRIRCLPSHHLAHAYSAYWPSGFPEAVVLVADASGSTRDGLTESYSLYHAQGEQLTPLHQERVPSHLAGLATLGFLYEEISRRAGFVTRVGGVSIPEAGKLMGLAAYGGPQHRWPRWITPRPGDYSLDIPAYDIFLDLAALEKHYDDGSGKAYLRPYLVDLAWKIQHELEEALRHLVSLAVAETGVRRLCLAGGVALNSVANYTLYRELELDDIFVFPAAGDAGIAAGAALWAYAQSGGRERPPLTRATLGRRYDDDEVERAVEARRERLHGERLDDDGLLQRAAEALARGHVVACFRGGSEFGPRALGHRSILADPVLADMKAILNARVKFREAFRPFAPVIPRERMGEVFERDVPAPFMLLVAPIRSAWRSRIPAVTHVDGSGRVQTVTTEDNPFLHALCLRLAEHRGDPPVLLNTSFNVAGQPIVETPGQAIDTFLASDIDYLILEDRWISKRDRPPADYQAHRARLERETLPRGLPEGADYPEHLVEALDRALFHGEAEDSPWSDEELDRLSLEGARYKPLARRHRRLPHGLRLPAHRREGRLILHPRGESLWLGKRGEEAHLDWDEAQWLIAEWSDDDTAREALRRHQGLSHRQARRLRARIRQLLGDPLPRLAETEPLPPPARRTLEPFADPDFRLHRRLEDLHDHLQGLGYREEALCRRLDLASLQRLEPTWLPYLDRYHLGQDPLDDLIRLFQLRAALPEARLKAIFGESRWTLLRRLGLVAQRSDGWAATVDLFPVDGLLIATDHRYFIHPEDRLDEEPVMYLGLDSVGLLHAAPRRAEDDVLDLCTGSGIQALVAARHAGRVVGVDLNPRALRFARFNAQLNGLENVEFRQGDLYRPVAGERFDRILANPPFVPSPDSTLAFRDGGAGGEAILARIVEGAGGMLRPGGRLHIVTDLVNPAGYPEKLNRWWHGGAVDGLILTTAPRDAARFAIPHAHAPFGQSLDEYRRQLCRWVDNLRQAGITAVDFGYLFLHRRERGPGRWTMRVVHSPEHAIHHRVAAHFRQWQRWEDSRRGDERWYLGVEPALYAEVSQAPDGRRRYRLTTPDDPYFSHYEVTEHDAARLAALAQRPCPVQEVVERWGETWVEGLLRLGLVCLDHPRRLPRRSLFPGAVVSDTRSDGVAPARVQERPSKTTPTCLSAYLRR